MGNTDSIPVVSQVKSVVQAVAGDSEGAKQTQINFTKGCPVVSQVRTIVQAIDGDEEGAKETLSYFWKGVGNLADGTPGVGHVKGMIHYACGDRDGGDDAMKAASRTTGVMAGGVGGFVVGGPAGAVAGGIAGGAFMDSTITVADSAIHQESRPYGYYQALDRAIDGKITPGEVFDTCLTPVFDGLTGHGAGKVYNKIRIKISRRNAARNAKFGLSSDNKMDIIYDSESSVDSGFESDMTSSSWENHNVNTLRVDNNCANCSLAGVEGLTVEQLIEKTHVIPDGRGSSIQTIYDMHKSLGHDCSPQVFGDVSQMTSYLDNNLQPGQKLKLVMGYERNRGQTMGHAVSIKAKKLSSGTLSYKTIDFQVDAKVPRKYVNSLPPSYQSGNGIILFETCERYY